MFKTGVCRARIHHVRSPELLEIMKTLDWPCIHDSFHQRTDINGQMNLIVVSNNLGLLSPGDEGSNVAILES
jgi:hypothetical protein